MFIKSHLTEAIGQ